MIYNNFAEAYKALVEWIPSYVTDIKCRGMRVVYEMVNREIVSTENDAIYIYSSPTSRVVPIRFILAEFLWIVAARNDVATIARFNKRMVNYSDDGVVLNGAYGYRMMGQIERAISLLIADQYSRQACMTILHPIDCLPEGKSNDIPCNCFLQFLILDNALHFRVISRSSDFVTGLSIDIVHWQILFHCVLNTLRGTYPNLIPGEIIYNLGSIHVYEQDKEMVNKWSHGNDCIHSFKMRDTYEGLKLKATKYFHLRETMDDICLLYSMHNDELVHMLRLNDLFISHKERPKR